MWVIHERYNWSCRWENGIAEATSLSWCEGFGSSAEVEDSTRREAVFVAHVLKTGRCGVGASDFFHIWGILLMLCKN